MLESQRESLQVRVTTMGLEEIEVEGQELKNESISSSYHNLTTLKDACRHYTTLSKTCTTRLGGFNELKCYYSFIPSSSFRSIESSAIPGQDLSRASSAGDRDGDNRQHGPVCAIPSRDTPFVVKFARTLLLWTRARLHLLRPSLISYQPSSTFVLSRNLVNLYKCSESERLPL